MFDGEGVMVKFFNLFVGELDILCVFLMFDLFKWEILEVGLWWVQGKVVVNFILFKDGEVRFLECVWLLWCYGVVVVVMVFDEQGQVDNFV